jgi:23S rRNA pseudouridine955/2504/2580 synthase
LSHVKHYTATHNEEGQRIDNFLLRTLKGVPKSRIYRIIRKGEVRVNKKRIKAEYKLQHNDIIRIPPIQLEEKPAHPNADQTLLNQLQSAILFEDDSLIVLNKPSGLGVHGGSHSPLGVIEILRELKHDLPYLELAHRLDLETSGLLLIAKNRATLQALHTLFREKHSLKKYYTTLVSGTWKQGKQTVSHTLNRVNNQQQKVKVSHHGKVATTTFSPLTFYKHATLMEVQIHTGRMHQIRTQLAHLNHPILGDTKYGKKETNQNYQTKFQLNRLFLHAHKLSFTLKQKNYTFEAQLPQELQTLLTKLPTH